MKLLLCRHGETKENKKRIINGRLQGHLSREGRIQAKIIADHLKDIKIDIIYTSDLKRCIDTTKAIAKFHKNTKVVKEKALRERDFGEFEGKSYDKIDWEKLKGDITDNRPKGGETFIEVKKRVEKFYGILLKKHTNDTVLLVLHGGPLRIIHSIIQKIPLKQALVDMPIINNTAISEYEVKRKGKYKLILFNSDKHLTKI